jgi:two-component system sensor histidine kinase UhpB
LLDDASALAAVAFDTVRRITMDLRPAIFDQMGIWDALDWYVSQLARRSSMRCEYLVDGALKAISLGRERELMLFRVVREALTNVERHAGASKVSVRFIRAGATLDLTVADDGIGIKDHQMETGATLGISGMRERARDFNGTLTVSSAGGTGTVLRLTLPLERCDDD